MLACVISAGLCHVVGLQFGLQTQLAHEPRRLSHPPTPPPGVAFFASRGRARRARPSQLGRCHLLLVGSGWVFALRDSFLNRTVVSPVEAAKVMSGTKQKHRKISAAPIVQLTAHAQPILVQSYLQYRFCWQFLLRWIKRRFSAQVPEKRNPTRLVAAYPQPPHGPHADRMEGPFSWLGSN